MMAYVSWTKDAQKAGGIGCGAEVGGGMTRLYLPDYEAYYIELRDKNYVFELTRPLFSSLEIDPYSNKLLVEALKESGLNDADARQRVLDMALEGRKAVKEARKKLARIPNFEEARKTFNVDKARVLWLLEEHFNLEEINALTFEFDIDYDKLPDQEKRSKTIELIKYCEQSGKLQTLLANAHSRCPNAHWESCLYIEV